MRKSVFFLVLLVAMGTSYAQQDEYKVEQGDMVILGQPSGSAYKHLDFPRKNIIIKRGAIANFNGLIGKQLIVDSIFTNNGGNTTAVLKRKDGLNFFRFYPTVTANLEKAFANGELRIKLKEDAIAQK